MNLSDLFPYWPALRPAYPSKVGTLTSILSGPVPPQGTRAVPSDVVGCTLEVASDGKWHGSLGEVTQAQLDALTPEMLANLAQGSPSNPFPGAASLPANPAQGARAWLEMLGGGGIFEVLYTNGSWRPRRGEAIVDLLDPVALIAPGSTTPVDFTLCTIPSVLWPKGACMRVKFTFESGITNIGSDGFILSQNSAQLLPSSIAPNTLYPVEMVFQRVDANIYRRLIIFPGGVSTTNTLAFSVGFPSAQVIALRVTPANGANTFRVRRFSISRD